MIGAVCAAETAAEEPRHLIVYQEAGRYAAWPANHGIWSWGDEILVGFEIGYPRTVQRPDGKLVTVYYFTDSKESLRYIAATIWDPNELKAGD